MKGIKNRKLNKVRRFFKSFFEELAGSVIVEAAMNIILFIPKVLLRMLKHIDW